MAGVLVNGFYFIAGICFLALSKARYILLGYRPKPLSIHAFESCTAYDINVVTKWLNQYQQYTGESTSTILTNKTVLELGPGSDLGVGLYILSKSANAYHAVDVYNLVEGVPDQFYEYFFSHLRAKDKVDTSPLVEELRRTQAGDSKKLNYHWRPDFNIADALGMTKVDIIFSNAAFEHFDNVPETVRAISAVSKSGTVIIASVDLKTHSRWIRKKDPINIYRYPKWLYRLLSFRGTPNRVRPFEYQKAFAENGWTKIKIEPSDKLDDVQYRSVSRHLANEFIGDISQMNYTSIWISATKS